MTFKKNNIENPPSFIANLIWLIALSIILFLWIFLIKNANFFNFKIIENNINSWSIIKNNESNNLSTVSDSKVIKDNNKIIKNDKVIKDNNKINILLAWRWWWNHDAPNLTDTIILASINLDTKTISMLSIPRDFYVEYTSMYSSSWTTKKWKINWIYAIYNFKNNSQKIWMNTLRNKVSEITWEKIDFFINVDFKWFTKIIDTIWWIKMTVPNNFIDEKYPDWNWWYKTLIFKKWIWLFDWSNSLKYARSRHSTSDFDRSIRQQQVIKAIKEKLTWSYFLTSPWKIKELYEVFINHVYTDLNLQTIIKLAYSLNWPWDFKIISSNLNDSCFYWSDTCEKWWLLYSPNRELFWWMSVLLAEWTDIENLNNYKKIHKYTNIVFNLPKIFKENYKINIFNSIKVNHLAWKLSNDIVKYWFNVPSKNSIWNTDKIYKESTIYYNNINDDSVTLKAIKYFFNWKIIKTNKSLYSKTNANIEIIIWEDYLSNKSPFKF